MHNTAVLTSLNSGNSVVGSGLQGFESVCLVHVLFEFSSSNAHLNKCLNIWY